MQYSDNQFKWAAVLNRKVPLPQLMNALGHIALGMQNRCNDPAAAVCHSYAGRDGITIASLSNWPVIVLQAKNGSQLKTLRESALAAGVPCQAFTNTMIGQSAEDQLEKTRSAAEDELEFWAVLLFGKSEELQALTKKFSLFSHTSD